MTFSVTIYNNCNQNDELATFCVAANVLSHSHQVSGNTQDSTKTLLHERKKNNEQRIVRDCLTRRDLKYQEWKVCCMRVDLTSEQFVSQVNESNGHSTRIVNHAVERSSLALELQVCLRKSKTGI